MLKKVDIERVGSDPEYRSALKRRGEIQLFWLVSITWPIFIVMAFFAAPINVLLGVTSMAVLASMFSCISTNAFTPFVIYRDFWRMWKSGLAHVTGIKLWEFGGNDVQGAYGKRNG